MNSSFWHFFGIFETSWLPHVSEQTSREFSPFVLFEYIKIYWNTLFKNS